MIQNHELESYDNEFGAPHVPGTVYDPGAASGLSLDDILRVDDLGDAFNLGGSASTRPH